LKDRAEFHERQAVVFFDQQLQAVGQLEFLDGMIGVGLDVGRGLGAAPSGRSAYSVRFSAVR